MTAADSGRAALITGVGGYVPPLMITNDDICARLATSDEWIRSRTGIGRRFFIEPGMTTGDMAVRAGELALKSSGDPDVDAVIVATMTPDRQCPSTAPDVAARLGQANVAAYDVQAACAGFLYGLASAAGLIAVGTASRVLVIGSETFSTIVNPADRDTAAIFADGAGAVVLEAGDASQPGAIGNFDLGSDGGLCDIIQIPAGGARQRSVGGVAASDDYFLQMRGREVYRQAVERMTASAQAALNRAGWDPADVDRFAPHQANARISAAVAQQLGLGPDQVLSNIADVGNTSAASIPLLLAQAAVAGRLAAGQRVLLAAFGAGLAWAAATCTWPAVTALTEGGR